MTAEPGIHYRSFAEQALHYFGRPHDGIPDAAVDDDADWRGPDMKARPDDWTIVLGEAQQAEIAAAVAAVRSAGLPMAAVNRDNFPLPELSKSIGAWRARIETGPGFILVRGLPVLAWGDQDAAMAFWGLGHHLGLPGAQNPQNELLGHVVDYDEEKDNPHVRRYRTTGNIDFHCDAADAVGLLCLRKAKAGGQSRIASSVAIYNEVARRRPDLVARLFEPFKLDTRGESRPGDPGYVEVPPCRYAGGRLRTFYHSEYFRSASRHADVGALDAGALALLDLYDELAASPDYHLDMWLEPGDMQFISNHSIVHARTAYEDHAEPDRKRHLLRLWLSFE